MNALRVVLDTNVFTPQHFDLLDVSPTRDLCRRKRIVPLYTGPFFEEMTRAYMKDKVRDQLLERWFPFVIETADRFCEDLSTIWHREVVRGAGQDALIFMQPREQREMIERIRALPEDGSWPLIPATEPERLAEAARLNSQRELSKRMRTESSLDFGSIRPPGQARVNLSDPAVRHLVGIIGRGMIEQHIGGANWRAAVNRWERDKASYRYLTQVATNIVYKELLFMQDHSLAIDKNAQPDLDLMTFLLDADVFVTNEQGFARRAFADLWQPRGKVIFTSAEFVGHLNSM